MAAGLSSLSFEAQARELGRSQMPAEHMLVARPRECRHCRRRRSVRGRDEIWRVLCRGSFHEGEDRLLDGTVIPGGERGGATGHDGFRYLGRRSCSAQSGCRPRSTATPFPWASVWLEDGLLHFGVQGRVGVRARNRADPSGGMALGWVRVDCPSYGAKSRCTLVAEGPARAASVGAGAFAR